MKTLLLVVAVLVAAPTATAAWQPGTQALAFEEDVEEVLLRTAEKARCLGDPRYHHNRYGYQVHDCTVVTVGKYSRYFCFMKLRVVKGSYPGRFGVRQISGGCY